MNIDSATTNAALLVGLAIILLIAAGWRKPARANGTSARARRTSPFSPSAAFPTAPHPAEREPVHEVPTEAYRPPSLWRRLVALTGSTTMAVVLGAILATLVGFASAMAVVQLTDLLKQ